MEWFSVRVADATLSVIGYQLQEVVVKRKPLI